MLQFLGIGISKKTYDEEYTVCPEVGDTFDAPCFSEVGAPIHEIFYMVIVGSGTFRLVYNNAW